MNQSKHYFFCGVGGSGMLPLAMILRAQGHHVAGSDRALDQGRTAAKFDDLRAQGVQLFHQDGAGVTSKDQIFVASAAVEDTIPDVMAANRVGAQRVSRAELLAALFNAADQPIGVAGTSGKSTTTAMLAWIFHALDRDPTVMNGAVMKNFTTTPTGAPRPFASALVGDGPDFISEIDESDGSIALFDPKIALVNNVALDHKSMDELRALFGEFTAKAETAVLNLDNVETRLLATQHGDAQYRTIRTYSLIDTQADFYGGDLEPKPDGVSFKLHTKHAGTAFGVQLRVPGRHNVSNALAAIAAAHAAGLPLTEIVNALSQFQGVRRRLEYVGVAGEIHVFDDFAHNPDKIAASLSTLHQFPGRLIIMFQPHGFGPLRLMKDEFIDCFAEHLTAEDRLYMPDPVYYGGTTDRSVTSRDIVAGLTARQRTAFACDTRDACAKRIRSDVRAGDRIIVMGARDDTLSTFARDLLAAIG